MKLYQKEMIKANSRSAIPTTLGQIYGHSSPASRIRKIHKLFEEPQRVIFELTYLYTSPHINTDSSFREIVKILENFNQETESLKIKPNYSKKISKIQISCMHLLYQQMLNIAVMGDKELKVNNFAVKLKQWYLSLHENHSFLEGVGLTWKKIRQNKENNMQEKIRQTFKSNVYDQIEDYLRKKVNHSSFSNSQQEEQNQHNWQSTNISHNPKKINLPYIDTLMYKRQESMMNDIRQKKIEKQYLNTFIANKSRSREISINKVDTEFLFRSKAAVTEHQKNVSTLNTSFRYQNEGSIKSKNENQSNSNMNNNQNQNIRFNLRKNSKIRIRQSQQRNSVSVMNVNGINIMNSKYE